MDFPESSKCCPRCGYRVEEVIFSADGAKNLPVKWLYLFSSVPYIIFVLANLLYDIAPECFVPFMFIGFVLKCTFLGNDYIEMKRRQKRCHL